MRFLQFRRFLCALLLCFALSSAALAQTSSSIGSIFNNKGELGIESVRNTAQSQSTATPYYKSNSVENLTYEGYFKAASSNTKLALLSDDGSSVWINGQQVLSRAGQGQGFENFDAAFTPLSQSFTAGKIYHLKVEYTNTVHTSDADVDGVSLWAYDGGGEMVSLSVTATTTGNVTAICAGGIADDVHRAEIVATVKDSDGVAVPNIPVTFTVENSNSEYPASLTESSATTDSQGKAKTKLTSSRKINATAIVKAEISGGEASSPSISMADATEDWDISPDALEADDKSTATVSLTLKYGDQKVKDHQITWRINEIWDTEGNSVYKASPQTGSMDGYGSLSANSSTTDSDGLTTATYKAGTKAGKIQFATLDYTMVANSPRKRIWGKKLDVGAFYVYTYLTDPSAIPSFTKTTSGVGTVTGSRNSMKFSLTLNSLIKKYAGSAPPPSTINFVRKRFANNQAGSAQAGTIPGTLESNAGTTAGGETTWHYWSTTPTERFNPITPNNDWNITQLRGRWQISVQLTGGGPLPAQYPAYFKIDKRDQIVTLAKTYNNAPKGEAGGGSNCDDFASAIYAHLGLPLVPSGLPAGLSPNGVTALFYSMNRAGQNTKPGSIIFYQFPSDTLMWRHAGISLGGSIIIDQNCTLPHDQLVIWKDPLGFQPDRVDHEPVLGQHSDSHPGLVNPQKYAAPSYYSTKELQDAESE